ncbi:MAG: deoxyhypusine synthase [Nitrososphaeraceae archaeon]|nr:deoxyhypusine synthase [Nitrososphaeraceae archaeon]MDW0238844.1 deoxyhypusine synthase [Nitrososphaeraceae archaeon]MDW0250495.1 deoxyhypusine synthase [Nitrososphaeraceae archaeon]MDW0263346.1 deoxyhypusine synthase [Nitrososphaeraceae archaeon]MDW0277020.1 deoxyhypusine synthase [Nitrososphaeraceae archaeon]
MKSKGSKKTHKDILSDSVRDYEIESKSISLLVDGMANSGGFESKNLWNGINIIRTMTGDTKCTKFLSFVGSIISTGARGIIKDMLKRKMFDCVITTCGALDHDIARSSTKYYSGDFRMDDKMLYKRNIHRLGNVLVPVNSYGPVIEKKVQECLNDLYKKGIKNVPTYEITRSIGSSLNESSFLYWAYKNDIPVVVPGIVDGAVGSQIWFFYQKHRDFNLNLLLDETKLSDLVYEAGKTGAFIIGGGISKHHTLWWNQFRGGLDYAVSITTASEWDGSLSGALVAEAISWGKVKGEARQTTIHGEATTLLPFIYAALLK